MDLSITPGHIFASGEIVETNKKNLDRLIAEMGDLIGIKPPEPKYQISHISEEVSRKVGVNATYSPRLNKFTSTSEQHEAILAHEAIHYLMNSCGLLFGPFIPKANFYDQLVDETVAEHTPAVKYGYTDLFGSDPSEIYQTQKELGQKIETISKSLGIGDTLTSLFQKIDPKAIEIASEHRKVENSFLDNRNPKLTREEAGKFHSWLSDEGFNGYISEAAHYLAGWNTTRIKNSGITPKELVSWIDDAVDKNWNSYGIYFHDIIGAIEDEIPEAINSPSP
tara:strand:+ start:494 stop:1333 length:840 start_codon:yes stop_codon:yes gene_type:complete